MRFYAQYQGKQGLRQRSTFFTLGVISDFVFTDFFPRKESDLLFIFYN